MRIAHVANARWVIPWLWIKTDGSIAVLEATQERIVDALREDLECRVNGLIFKYIPAAWRWILTIVAVNYSNCIAAKLWSHVPFLDTNTVTAIPVVDETILTAILLIGVRLTIDCFGRRGLAKAVLVRHCNIFHMSGGNAWNIIQDWRSRPDCLQVLKGRVQHGEVLYVGSSGGSIAAGLDMKYCVDDRSGLCDMDMNGLGIVGDMKVGVHHSNRNTFDKTDEISMFLGPQTAIFLNGLQCQPAMTSAVNG